jgi:hypothetical protein
MPKDFSQLPKFQLNKCCGNSMIVCQSTISHLQHVNVLIHLVHLWQWMWEMLHKGLEPQLLYHSIICSSPAVSGFQPTSRFSAEQLLWNLYNSASICPSTE